MRAKIAAAGRLSTLGSLYFTQFLPFSFFTMAIPVIMRQQGYSMEQIGYIHMVGIPYLLKFLWAPAIDRFGRRKSHYKNWIFVLTICYALTMFVISFFRLEDQLGTIAIILSVAVFFIATQDIAVDGLAIKVLRKNELGIGNGIQSAGAYVGYLFGGGFMLMYFDRIGWQYSVWLLSGILLLSALPVIFLKEPMAETDQKASFRDLGGFFKIKGMWQWLLILIFSSIPLQVGYHFFKPMLVDFGMENDEIGIYIIYGMISGIVMGLIGGALLKLTGYRLGFLLIFLLKSIGIVVLLLIATGWNEQSALITAALVCGGLASMGHAAVYSISMQKCRPGREGTDFTMQNALSTTITFLIYPLVGRVGDRWGFEALMATSAILQGIGIVIVLLMFRLREKEEKKEVSPETELKVHPSENISI